MLEFWAVRVTCILMVSTAYGNNLIMSIKSEADSVQTDRLLPFAGDIPTNQTKRFTNDEPNEWTPWSPWSPCSRPCGGGVTMQVRQCISQPKKFSLARKKRKHRPHRAYRHGEKTVTEDVQMIFGSKKNCSGSGRRFQICNDVPCVNSFDFRFQQCASFNVKKFKGKSYMWKPYYKGHSECQLNCQPIGENFYAILNKSVIDGTKCLRPINRPVTLNPAERYKRTRAVCVQGLCLSVDADGVIGRDYDANGVIARPPAISLNAPHANLQSRATCAACADVTRAKCRLVSGIFTKPILTHGYNPIAVIPVNACHVNVTQMKASRNYIVLRALNGSFILNGNWEVNMSGEYPGADTTFHYHRQDNQYDTEFVHADGPLSHAVELMVLSQAPNPGVKYEYKVAVLDAKDDEQIAPPYFDSRRHAFMSTRFQQGDDPKATKTTSTYPRATRRKKFAWRVTPLQECSRSCGGGTQLFKIACVREHTQISVHERKCAHVDKPVPATIKCNIQACPPHWVEDAEWSACSNACGEGEQTRDVRCVQEVSAKLMVPVADGECAKDARPDARRTCFLRPCVGDENAVVDGVGTVEKAHWKTGPWSQCSSTCGEGFQTRSITCVTNKPGEECLTSEKPISLLHCRMRPCVDASKSAGLTHKSPTTTSSAVLYHSFGHHRGPYTSHTPHGPTNSVLVTDMNRLDGQFKPDDHTRDEYRNPYVANTPHGSINSVVVTDVNRSTDQFKRDEPDDAVDDANIVAGTTARSADPQKSDERISITNGNSAMSTNNSIEFDRTNRIVDSHVDHKSVENPPNLSGAWLTSEWSDECSNECGVGQQHRSVVCSGNCSPTNKPDTTRACSSDRKCTTKWYAGPWSECIDHECNGHATQTRDTLCIGYVKGQFRIVSDRTCTMTERPETERACSLNTRGNCMAKWHVSEWDESECNGDDCDNFGEAWRVVKCTDRDGREATACGTVDRPSERRGCLKAKHCHRGAREKSDVNVSMENHDQPVDGNCKDKIFVCQAAVQARLCAYEYYENACCLSCNRAFAITEPRN